jgi:predicted membrane protein
MKALHAAIFIGAALTGASLSALYFTDFTGSSLSVAGYTFLAATTGIGAIVAFTVACFLKDQEPYQ